MMKLDNKNQKILEMYGCKYSSKYFKNYKYRGIFNFNVRYNTFKSIEIYTTDNEYLNVIKILNKRKADKVNSITLYDWCSKEQDDNDADLFGW